MLTQKKKFKLPQISSVCINAIMVFVLLVVLVPMLNLVAKSFSDPAKVAGMPGWQIIPAGFSLINYEIIFSNPAIWRALLNSVFITVVGVALNVVVTSMAAYAMTRPVLPGKKLFMAFFIMMMIFEPGIIQEYFVIKGLGLMDNLWSMVLYNTVTVYNLILLMRFFSDTPEAILEAAAIDGAGHLNILFKVFLPMNKIPIMTVGMFYAVARWNEFFRSSVFLTSNKNTVLQVFLRRFVVEGDSTVLASLGNIDLTGVNMTSLKSATIVVVILPILCMYPFILKHYTSGVMQGGVKE
ncbi:MAG: carbohydrate ABC transporter permease [Flintibacter sp.]|uniref:carbohydrate ABC transporter permease n=1 Tax=Flintibacter sp. TaxID=1918624 RepID=UPI0026738ECA|nr:carbohydrate ABC transporter permease [Flintibacter sp.]MCI6151442.1 carbohydrate ABC transporter permease [Flintibacter sp.]MDD7115121.1 carbohydrate ABC transporter permease [Flintibacter sp.]MDY5038375.1 carbohydrate ABC transporter permease [Lawsonibacter sp.]